MASFSSSNQIQSNLPMIVALKGLSSLPKIEIALNLAEYLRSPLIDEDDIIEDLKDSLPNSSKNKNNASADNLSYKILTKITKTQLRLKLNYVVINASLSQTNQVDLLIELATSKNVRFVIVECYGGSGDDQITKVNNVDNLSIDITKKFIVQDFVKAINDSPLQVINKEESRPIPKVQKIPRRILMEAHAHELSSSEKPKISSNNILCNRCDQSLSGKTYQCVVCDEFNLHKSCAEWKPTTDSFFSIDHSFYLYPNPIEYDFLEKYNCRKCEKDDYSSHCNSCLLQTHIKGGSLPTILRYEKHEHPLNFVIMPFCFKYEYKCCACEEYGKFISYKCYSCNFDLHLSCAILPEVDIGKLVFLEGVKRFDLEDLLRASNEMLGKGKFGTTYKASLDDENVVAVKRLTLRDVTAGGKRELGKHMAVLGLRHSN